MINQLIDSVPFDVVAYTLDWHPEDHCSFIENVHKRGLSANSPVLAILKKDLEIYELILK